MLLKCCTKYAIKFGKLSRTGKVSFHSNPKTGSAKGCSNYCTTALISQACKVMLQILQARLQQYMNRELQMFKLDFKKAEESESKLPICIEALKNARESKSLFYTSVSLFLSCI